jgi:hypothetical protein
VFCSSPQPPGVTLPVAVRRQRWRENNTVDAVAELANVLTNARSGRVGDCVTPGVLPRNVSGTRPVAREVVTEDDDAGAGVAPGRRCPASEEAPPAPSFRASTPSNRRRNVPSVAPVACSFISVERMSAPVAVPIDQRSRRFAACYAFMAIRCAVGRTRCGLRTGHIDVGASLSCRRYRKPPNGSSVPGCVRLVRPVRRPHGLPSNRKHPRSHVNLLCRLRPPWPPPAQ